MPLSAFQRRRDAFARLVAERIPRVSPRRAARAGVAATLALGFAGQADAQDAGAGADGWSVGLAPDVWFASLKGDVAVIPGLSPVSVDAGFNVMDNTDFAFMLAGEALASSSGRQRALAIGGSTRPRAAADSLLANDPLPICYGRPEAAITGIVLSGRIYRRGGMSVWRVRPTSS